MIYATEYEINGYRTNWKNVSLTAPPTYGFNHTMFYMIQDLDPATQYEVKVSAKNRFGWSEPSNTFRFTTRGADTNSDMSNDIYTGLWRHCRRTSWRSDFLKNNLDVWSETEMRDMTVMSRNEARPTLNASFVNVFVIFACWTSSLWIARVWGKNLWFCCRWKRNKWSNVRFHVF